MGLTHLDVKISNPAKLEKSTSKLNSKNQQANRLLSPHRHHYEYLF